MHTRFGSRDDDPNPDESNKTRAQVARHIIYLGTNIGWSNIGLGSDFDGIHDTPRGLSDVSQFPALVVNLLEAGLEDSIVRGIVGENVLRVWKEVERVVVTMKGKSPGEDDAGQLSRPA
jgi:membrane dipeptidase